MTHALCKSLMVMGLAVMAAGCSNEPDQEWAEATYEAERADIDAVFAGLKAQFQTFAPVHYEALPQDLTEREAARGQMMRRRDAFDEASMKLLKSYPKLIGWELHYAFPEKDKPPIPYSFKQASDHVPSWKPGLVRAERRKLKKDDRLLGWGLFMIPGKETKTKVGLKALNYYKGLEVIDEIEHEGATLSVALFIVPDQGE